MGLAMDRSSFSSTQNNNCLCLQPHGCASCQLADSKGISNLRAKPMARNYFHEQYLHTYISTMVPPYPSKLRTIPQRCSSIVLTPASSWFDKHATDINTDGYLFRKLAVFISIESSCCADRLVVMVMGVAFGWDEDTVKDRKEREFLEISSTWGVDSKLEKHYERKHAPDTLSTAVVVEFRPSTRT